MNFLQLKELCSYWLDDTQFGYFTTTQVGIWLNNAQREVQKRLMKAGQNYYTKDVYTTMIVNQRRYTLPSDFRKLNRLEVVTSGVIPNETAIQVFPITINQVDLTITGTGTPQYYYLDHDVITLQPTPDTALPLRMIYSYDIVDMVADADTPDVPTRYEELIALLAAEDGFIKDGRPNALIEKKIAQYQQMMDEDAQDRQQDTVRMVVSTGQDFNGGQYW